MKNKIYKFDVFSSNDVEQRVAAINSYDVLSGIFIEVPATVKKTEAWANSISNNTNRKDFVLREKDKAIAFSGLVNINNKHGNAELYIFVSENFSAKGIGSYLLECTLKYAKDELNLRKITLYVSEGNEKACKFYEKFSFFKEGTLKKHSWHRGKYLDRYIYSLFLDNFKSDLNIYKAMQ
ncbi:GNAT family N-acetyltransferase [Advenella sp. EE-W14]|uniref:GNAT family N-acetyltransferase n=1 Tax=Advenella sp. EE-W14 TaxID=2722705 RepID=UPI00145DA688|nr:GNAT family protein [Advenella sp. EE-W14]